MGIGQAGSVGGVGGVGGVSEEIFPPSLPTLPTLPHLLISPHTPLLPTPSPQSPVPIFKAGLFFYKNSDRLATKQAVYKMRG
ncbi:hypothetical protein A6S26_16955 [Nostoc sp. ATCC 43529]|nr:hypothetical protein A6S26_16955 [Nostoc sp. ATCC 43529]